jgi:hypothetical protein
LSGQSAGAVAAVRLKVRDHERFGRLGNLGARRRVARDRLVADSDTRLEPLPIAVGQRDRRNWEAEDLSCHAGNPIEALARRGIKQVQPVQCVKTSFFIVRHTNSFASALEAKN